MSTAIDIWAWQMSRAWLGELAVAAGGAAQAQVAGDIPPIAVGLALPCPRHNTALPQSEQNNPPKK